MLRSRSRAIAGLGLAALGCASPTTAKREPRRVEVVEHVAGASAGGSGPFAIDVRMATEADVTALGPARGERLEVTKASGTLLLMSGVLAVMGCPICLSNAVVAAGFAIVAPPVLAAVAAVERDRAERVQAALAARDLPERTHEALARLGARPPDTLVEHELVIVGYGFADAGDRGACFFLDARLATPSRGDEGEAILLGPWRRSDDAPAPHCASARALAEEDGALAARIVDESAEILAGIALRRMGESP